MSGSQYWWYRYTKDGQRYAVSLRTADESEAITRARAVAAEGLIAAASYVPNEPAPRKREINSLIEQYLAAAQSRNKKPLRPLTANTRRYVLKQFCSDMGVERVSDITGQKITQWLKHLKDQNKSRDTQWTYGERLRNFVKFLTPKYLPSNILYGFELPEPSPTGRKNWLPKTVVTKLIEGAQDSELKFILFAIFHTGLRRNEVSEMRVGWFDLEHGLLQVTNDASFTSKDRDNRVVPLTDAFLAFAKTFLAGRDKTEYVLAPEKTGKGKNKYRFDCSKRVRTYFEKSNVECTLHDARRSFASNLVSGGVTLFKVAAWLGDGHEITARSYAHLAPRDADVNRGV